MKNKTYRWLIIIFWMISLTLPLSTGLADSSTGETPDAPAATYYVFIPYTRGNVNPPANPGNGTVINHQSLAIFNTIPDNYIQAASNLHLLFRHASVGNNISIGLDCLMNKVQPRPYSCDSSLPLNQIIYDPKYNRNNWAFEYHAPPPGQNPPWWDKVYIFINRIDELGASENYDVVGFKFGYVDGYQGSEIDNLFFNNVPNDPYSSIEDLEALEVRHPDKVIVYWTMGLARLTYAESRNFNQQLRSYATSHDKILIDIADIESHRPDGTPCYDNAGQGIEAMCQDYTTEVNGGHLNALGSQRMAKAVWIMMARIAGWNGQ